jgi:hypothetical protein
MRAHKDRYRARSRQVEVVDAVFVHNVGAALTDDGIHVLLYGDLAWPQVLRLPLPTMPGALAL